MTGPRCEVTELLVDQCGCRQHRGGSTVAELERYYEPPGPWFEASYYGTCSRCQESFQPGVRIRSDGGHGWECCS